MAGMGGWKVHWEVLPIGQLVFFIYLFSGIRPGLSARWVARVGGTEGRLQVLEGWEGGGQAGGLAWPDRASSVFNDGSFLGRLKLFPPLLKLLIVF